MKLYPTFTCFDDVVDIAGHLRSEHKDCTICHGIVSVSGQLISHAWVESGNECYEMKIQNNHRLIVCYPKDVWMKVVVEHTEYTIDEFMEETRKLGTVGPFLEKYRTLCGSDHKVVGELRF